MYIESLSKYAENFPFMIQVKMKNNISTYYPVLGPSFLRQWGWGSAACLDGLIAFLHVAKSSAKEVDIHSLSRSHLMLSNHLLFWG